MVALSEIPRHLTHAVRIGDVALGGGAPVVVQSMTNTDTADVAATTRQVLELAAGGLRDRADHGQHRRRRQSRCRGSASACGWPAAACQLVGDFHYHGHLLLTRHPDCAPGARQAPDQPRQCRLRRQARPPVRDHDRGRAAARQAGPDRRQLGAAWTRSAATRLMDDNARLAEPQAADEVLREALVVSAPASAAQAERIGLAADRIVISAKVSRVQDLIAVYRELARRSRYALHLGLTEAGLGAKGIVATAAALAVLLQEGIGDTIRAVLDAAAGRGPDPGGRWSARSCCRAWGCARSRPRSPPAPAAGAPPAAISRSSPTASRPICGIRCRSGSSAIPASRPWNVAVMGCIVNGPGESKHADIGISLPGTGESPAAPVFIDGKKALTLRGERIAEEFQALVEDYIERRYGARRRRAATA